MVLQKVLQGFRKGPTKVREGSLKGLYRGSSGFVFVLGLRALGFACLGLVLLLKGGQRAFLFQGFRS